MTASVEPTPGLVLQGITPPLRLNDYKLIAFDMDSTLINIECVDEIADGAEKQRTLLQTCARLSISPQQAIAMGDGANDLPMMGAAGLSVAYHAKPKVREQARVAINSGGLDRLLEILR
ncbi:MAG: HAD hydrolase family protein [Burkholderiaceae bacterium]|nr:HAD hydrolase family protein [Burkholderiaceae bacterium]